MSIMDRLKSQLAAGAESLKAEIHAKTAPATFSMAELPGAEAAPLSAEQLWALAATAQLNTQNGQNVTQLNPDPKQPVKYWRNSLRRWWNVVSRESLIETMSYLGKIGDEEEAANDIAWNQVRLIDLARWGYAAGYLNEKEAWDLALDAAEIVRETYTSWAHMAAYYKYGFEKQMSREADAGYMRAHDALIDPANAGSPWNHIVWEWPEKANRMPERKRLILVTGLSGAGKSLALKSLEDLGFEAVDNAPLRFITALAAQAPEGGMVVGTDARARDFTPEHFLQLIAALRATADVTAEVLFLDCDDIVLQRRYTETRRKHPLAQDRPVMDGITAERQMLDEVRASAETVIDTSDLSSTALRQLLQQRFGVGAERLTIQLVSFSFRQGIPREADLVFDVRFLRNPHYVPELRPMNGTDPRVGAYVEEDEAFAPFFQGLGALLLPLLPRYLAEGKSYLTIAVGCTGGKHRSVHTAQKLAGFLEQKGYKTTLRHRDLGRE